MERRRFRIARAWMRPGTLLDFGCGSARVLGSLDPGHVHRYVGVEPDAGYRALAAEHVRRLGWEERALFFEKLVPDLERIAASGFDTILALSVLEHVDDLEETVLGLGSLLGRGGRLIVTFPSRIGGLIHPVGAALSLFNKEAAHEHKRVVHLDAVERLLRGMAAEPGGGGPPRGLAMRRKGSYLAGMGVYAVFEREGHVRPIPG